MLDAVVIGAGVAGLACAQQLHAQGKKVKVLEARARIGGRIHTDRSCGVAIDLGGSWIHGPDTNPLSEIVQAQNLNTFTTHDDALQLSLPQGPADPEKLSQLDEVYEALLERAETWADNRDEDTDLVTALSAAAPGALDDPMIAWALRGFCEFDIGGPAETISTWYFNADFEHPGEDVVLPQGMDAIVDSLSPDLDIALEHPILRVERSSDSVTVSGPKGVCVAKHAIVTLPIGVLAKMPDMFTPALPGRIRRAIAAIPMGGITKVALRFPERFWPADIHHFGYHGHPPGRFPYFANMWPYSGQAVLMGVCTGRYVAPLEARSNAEVTTDALDVLEKIFGRRPPSPSSVHVTRWSHDPYAGGTYSYSAVGVRPEHYEAFARPVARRLHFAGEHTCFAHHATMHGGLWTGRRAARAALANL